MRVKARVDDAAVCLAGPLGHVPGLFQHRNATVIAAQHTRQGTTHDTGTHDDDVAYQIIFPPSKPHTCDSCSLLDIVPCRRQKRKRNFSVFVNVSNLFPQYDHEFSPAPGQRKKSQKKIAACLAKRRATCYNLPDYAPLLRECLCRGFSRWLSPGSKGWKQQGRKQKWQSSP